MFEKADAMRPDEEVQIGFRLPQKDIDSFDQVAVKKRMSRSALLRQCVLEKIEENKA